MRNGRLDADRESVLVHTWTVSVRVRHRPLLISSGLLFCRTGEVRERETSKTTPTHVGKRGGGPSQIDLSGFSGRHLLSPFGPPGGFCSSIFPSRLDLHPLRRTIIVHDRNEIHCNGTASCICCMCCFCPAQSLPVLFRALLHPPLPRFVSSGGACKWTRC